MHLAQHTCFYLYWPNIWRDQGISWNLRFALKSFFLVQATQRFQENFRQNQAQQLWRTSCGRTAKSGRRKKPGVGLDGLAFEAVGHAGAVPTRRAARDGRRPTRLVERVDAERRTEAWGRSEAVPGMDHGHHRALDGKSRSGNVCQVRVRPLPLFPEFRTCFIAIL